MMKIVSHLWLQREHVPPAQELEFGSRRWQFLQLDNGQAYWLGPSQMLEVRPSEMLVLLPHHSGCLRASQLNQVDFHAFCFCPELLTGLLTLPDRHALETSLQESQVQPRLLPASHPLARQFARVARTPGQESTLWQRSQLLTLAVAVILEHIPRSRPRLQPIPAAATRFRLLVSRMTDSEWNCYTARELARMCGCSQQYFAAMFREYFGDHLRVRRGDGKLTLPFACDSCHRTEALEDGPDSAGGQFLPEEIVSEK